MSCTPNDPTAPAFLTHFQAVGDPRQEGKVFYPLEEILLLVLCGVISGADGWTSIALYGQKKLELLRRFLPFESGTPSHDQLGIFVISAGYGGIPKLLHKCGATLLVNMRDIEPRKEDDGFDGAFLSP